MTIVSMRIIEKPEKGTRDLLYFTDLHKSSIFAEGTGAVDFICGSCGNIVCKSMNACDVSTHSVFLCPKCEKYNEKECRYNDENKKDLAEN